MSKSVGKKKSKKGAKNGGEWRLLHEKEQREKREKLIIEFLLDKIKRENIYARLNAIKLDWSWRKVLRDLKTEELKVETQQMRDAFEKLVETKNNTIQLLVEEITENENIRLLSFSRHLKSADFIFGVQQQHLKNKDDGFSNQMKNLNNSFIEDEEKIKRIQMEAEESFNDFKLFCNDKHEELLKSIETEFQSRKYEILNKTYEEEKILKINSNTIADNLFTQLNQMVLYEQEQSEELRKSLANMKMKDELYKKEVQQQHVKIKKLQEVEKLLKEKLAVLDDEKLNGLEQYSRQKAELSSRVLRDRERMEQLKSDNELILLTLANSSSEAINYLQEKVNQGEKVLRWKRMCDLHHYVIEEESKNEIEEEGADNDSDDEIVNKAMVSFWRNYNQTFFDQCVLKSRHRALKFENLKLRSLMKQYLEQCASSNANCNYS